MDLNDVLKIDDKTPSPEEPKKDTPTQIPTSVRRCTCNDSYDLDTAITERALRRVPAWDISRILGFAPFYVAGSSLNAESPNDIDVYPTVEFKESAITKDIERDYEIVSKTRNAITFKIKGKTVQICSYIKPSLQALVDSFDFAHCQIGVKYGESEYNESYGEAGGYPAPEIDEVYVSENWKKAKLLQTTFFTGSEYPLSSLIRTVKYANRGIFSGKSYIIDMLKAVRDIIDRGYEDYDDFKDQLDAVDLNLLSDNDDETNQVNSAAWSLWKTLTKHGLVTKYNGDEVKHEDA